MVQELANTPFVEMIVICGKWSAALIVANFLLGFAWTVITAPLKGMWILLKEIGGWIRNRGKQNEMDKANH